MEVKLQAQEETEAETSSRIWTRSPYLTSPHWGRNSSKTLTIKNEDYEEQGFLEDSDSHCRNGAHRTDHYTDNNKLHGTLTIEQKKGSKTASFFYRYSLASRMRITAVSLLDN